MTIIKQSRKIFLANKQEFKNMQALYNCGYTLYISMPDSAIATVFGTSPKKISSICVKTWEYLKSYYLCHTNCSGMYVATDVELALFVSTN